MLSAGSRAPVLKSSEGKAWEQNYSKMCRNPVSSSLVLCTGCDHFRLLCINACKQFLAWNQRDYIQVSQPELSYMKGDPCICWTSFDFWLLVFFSHLSLGNIVLWTNNQPSTLESKKVFQTTHESESLVKCLASQTQSARQARITKWWLGLKTLWIRICIIDTPRVWEPRNARLWWFPALFPAYCLHCRAFTTKTWTRTSGTFEAALIKAALRRKIGSHLQPPKIGSHLQPDWRWRLEVISNLLARFLIQRIRTLVNVICVNVLGIWVISEMRTDSCITWKSKRISLKSFGKNWELSSSRNFWRWCL